MNPDKNWLLHTSRQYIALAGAAKRFSALAGVDWPQPLK
jgi:hypothetical protein